MSVLEWFLLVFGFLRICSVFLEYFSNEEFFFFSWPPFFLATSPDLSFFFLTTGLQPRRPGVHN